MAKAKAKPKRIPKIHPSSRYKSLMVKRGRCRQCGRRRGQSQSVSRCQACLDKASAGRRKVLGGSPWHSRVRIGRPPFRRTKSAHKRFRPVEPAS